MVVIGNGGGCLNDDESLGPVENESVTPNTTTKTSSINVAIIGDVGTRQISSDMAANNVKRSRVACTC